jgi:transketolase
MCKRNRGSYYTEEHSIYGGLGSVVPMEIIGVQDTFAETGAYELLLNKYGLCTENIINNVQKIIKRK